MERNKNYAWLLYSGILGMIAGAILCITIIGIIFGIPAIIGAKKYLEWSKVSDSELEKHKDELLIWGIVWAIMMFPLGLPALVPAFNTKGEVYEKVNEFKPTKTASKSKAERIKELSDLKEKGLISEEDFEIAKNKIISE